MNVGRQFCYTNSSGEDIYLYTLRNDRGAEVLISNYGAIITSFRIRGKNGLENDIVLGFEQMEDYLSPEYLAGYPWFGAAIGRYANRIKDGEFILDSRKYHLTKNRGQDTLHGGATGFDKRIWKFLVMEVAPEPFLELSYSSPDAEEGFPGNMEISIRFVLNDENELSYEYRAKCDRPTPINLTHHSYFNLNNGIGNIYDHEIRIPASNILVQGENLVANGALESVIDSAFDLRSFRKIADGLKLIDEYDKTYVLDEGNNLDLTKSLPLVAEARSENSGLHLEIYSTEPVVHFYSGKWTPIVKGKKGNSYGPYSGFCLETHKHPNAVNIPHFPNTILRPGEVYYQKTIYRVWEK